MRRHHNILLAAVLSVALSGCAVLVQYGEPDVQAVSAYQSLTGLHGAVASGPSGSQVP